MTANPVTPICAVPTADDGTDITERSFMPVGTYHHRQVPCRAAAGAVRGGTCGCVAEPSAHGGRHRRRAGDRDAQGARTLAA
ncbi:hypothetical protein Cph01nite_14840 [Cellulomonas phragmiteti]|uniref:Uncharacterized protein n=1 Tax=Cellulomonas phragmiteti TaxID=478780 RepID=A0ABQ4DK41_9CELL|nr:hypothetical protein Cph01nite_14840 [Cellulomonas phragmiteti]